MKEGILTTHKFTVRMPHSKQKIQLIPFGDIHRDAPGCDVIRWHDFLEKCKRENDKYTYYLGMGDYNDFLSPSERKAIRGASLHDTSIASLDRWAKENEDRFFKEIEFMGDNLIGMIEGNHEYEYAKGGTSTQSMCQRMGCKWLGNISAIRMKLFPQKSSSKYCSVDIIAAHGKAGGKCAGTTINQVDDLRKIFPAADIYIEGHDHNRGALPKSGLFLTGGRGDTLTIKQKRQWLARSGSFLRAYVEDTPCYIVRGLGHACELGTIRFDIWVHRQQQGKNDFIYPDIHVWA